MFYCLKCSFYCSEHYYRIDEPFGLGHLDLVDVHHEDSIKAQVDAWLQTGVVRDIVEKLGVKSVTAP